jgi:hypothetical protein
MVFEGKGGTYIKTQVKHKAPKGCPPCDIIYLEIVSKSHNNEVKYWAMSKKEAVVIATSLLHAVVLHGEKKTSKNHKG